MPETLRWLFWETAFDSLDVHRDKSYVLARILEMGRLTDVRWALETYGLETIHQFFREVGHTEISPKTMVFWKAFFKAEDESWASPPSWRLNSSIPWPA